MNLASRRLVALVLIAASGCAARGPSAATPRQNGEEAVRAASAGDCAAVHARMASLSAQNQALHGAIARRPAVQACLAAPVPVVSNDAPPGMADATPPAAGALPPEPSGPKDARALSNGLLLVGATTALLGGAVAFTGFNCETDGDADGCRDDQVALATGVGLALLGAGLIVAGTVGHLLTAFGVARGPTPRAASWTITPAPLRGPEGTAPGVMLGRAF